jgi:hypothetical protein
VYSPSMLYIQLPYAVHTATFGRCSRLMSIKKLKLPGSFLRMFFTEAVVRDAPCMYTLTLYMYIYVCMNVCVCVCVCMHIYMYICIHTHTHTRVHTHTHIHTHMIHDTVEARHDILASEKYHQKKSATSTHARAHTHTHEKNVFMIPNYIAALRA